MEISSLPEDCLLEIFRRLPFKDQIRIGRVNQLFRRVSVLAVGETKSLDMNEELLQYNFRPESLNMIFNLCSNQLEHFHLSDHADNCGVIEIFANYTFPKLTVFEADGVGVREVHDTAFRRLLLHNENLRRLKFLSETPPVFPPDVVSEKLVSLTLWVGDNDMFTSLVGRFPNLTHFAATDLTHGPTPAILDQFLLSVPKLERLELRLGASMIIERLPNLCNLSGLIELKIENDRIRYNDDELRMLTQNLGKVEKLDLTSFRIGPAGVAHLIRLKNLRHLKISISYEANQELGRLAENGILEDLELCSATVKHEIFVRLVHHCPRIRRLAVQNLQQVDTPTEAVTVLRNLIGVGNRRLDVLIEKYYSIWKWEELSETLMELKEKNGVDITFRHWRNGPFPWLRNLF